MCRQVPWAGFPELVVALSEARPVASDPVVHAPAVTPIAKQRVKSLIPIPERYVGWSRVSGTLEILVFDLRELIPAMPLLPAE
jgi:hypothetical protein